MRKPNLFIVGEQKSGTTSLHYYINQHPDIFMSPVKEPGYFCTDFHKESDKFHNKKIWYHFRTEDVYLKLFKDAKKEKYVGESSSIYLYSKEAAKNIHDFDPDSKILILLREPIGFLSSLHSQYLKETPENIKSFTEALVVEESRKKGQNLIKTVRAPSLLFYSDRIQYARNVERYFKTFKPEQIKVILAENFRKDIKGTVEDVFDFLGVEKADDINLDTQNIYRTPRYNTLHKILNLPLAAKAKTLFVEIFPADFVSRQISLFHKIFRKPAERVKLDTEVKQKLMKKYKDTVTELATLFKERNIALDPIKTWGYDKI